MVSLSRAIAAAMVHGPSTGLEQVNALANDSRIAGHYLLEKAARLAWLSPSGGA